MTVLVASRAFQSLLNIKIPANPLYIALLPFLREPTHTGVHRKALDNNGLTWVLWVPFIFP